MATLETKEVLESAYEFLLIELVNTFIYENGESAPPRKESVATDGLDEADIMALSLNSELDKRVRSRRKVEGIGKDVGKRLIERLAVDRVQFDSKLDTVRYICTEFWEAVFKKPKADNLMTNNVGRYVIADNNFRWISKLSVNDGALGEAQDFVIFPSGIICGALNGLGIECEVAAKATTPPACVFTAESARDEAGTLKRLSSRTYSNKLTPS